MQTVLHHVLNVLVLLRPHFRNERATLVDPVFPVLKVGPLLLVEEAVEDLLDLGLGGLVLGDVHLHLAQGLGVPHLSALDVVDFADEAPRDHVQQHYPDLPHVLLLPREFLLPQHFARGRNEGLVLVLVVPGLDVVVVDALGLEERVQGGLLLRENWVPLGGVHFVLEVLTVVQLLVRPEDDAGQDLVQGLAGDLADVLLLDLLRDPVHPALLLLLLRTFFEFLHGRQLDLQLVEVGGLAAFGCLHADVHHLADLLRICRIVQDAPEEAVEFSETFVLVLECQLDVAVVKLTIQEFPELLKFFKHVHDLFVEVHAGE